MAIVDSPAPTKPRRRVVLIAACLLLLLAVQAITSLTRKSVTTDEIMYITAGYYYLRTGEFDYNATHPPLMKIISALPLLALDPELPHVDSSPRNWSLIKQWQYSRMFFYENRVDADRMLLYARLPVVLLAVLLGVYVFVWARDLYGDRAALFSLFLFSFSPNILAHARLATTDLGLAAFVFMSCFHLWRYVRRPNIWSVIFCGLFLGMAVASKGTAALLGPIFVCYALVLLIRGGDYGTWSAWPMIRRFAPTRRRVRQFASIAWAAVLIGVVSVLVINAAYGFPNTFR
ncbi:MAG: glycosyltransferase family 39 protein, partial [Planctomycetes bacterium]|nr:glycosyltransferase family 39 protein [Planctomycetota bacterium]